MKATSLRRPGRIELVDVPWPEVGSPRDAVVRVTRSAICGTDLHPYRGEIPGFRPDTIMGHELVGVVEDAGPEAELAGVAVGSRVVASDVIACGSCWWCGHDAHYQCPHVSLFGYGEVVGSYVPGGQAEAVRVPFADTVLTPVPEDVDDDSALFVGDVLTTGWTAAAEAGVAGGDVVAVVGCGPVGLCAVLSAQLLGAATVVGVDGQAARRDAAAGLGAVAAAPDAARAVLDDLTDGRGADRVIEAVGSPAALAGALALARARGVVAAVGAHHEPAFPLDTGDAFGRELTLRFAVGDPIRWGGVLFAHLAAGRLDPARLVSHRLPLADAADAYALFDRGEATKVLLLPDSP
ncbi:MAG TPA: alcohol dehydrogenase catalytic domain-containing protein [Acidimicrobiales bacterium]|nr:alcohol dehydrogenase catalytic domain-containing protein [Acidimicrobiales bacterium]